MTAVMVDMTAAMVAKTNDNIFFNHHLKKDLYNETLN